MRTAEELREAITNKKITDLLENVNDDVIKAWNVIEDAAIRFGNCNVQLDYNSGVEVFDTILNSNCFDNFKKLLELKGYSVDEHYDDRPVIYDERGYIKRNKDAKIIGYYVSWYKN